MSSIKVRYRWGSEQFESVAYLDEPALPDGSYVGINKHTDMPVHLRWDPEAEIWVEVCRREFAYDTPLHLGTFHEVGERPDCTCKEYAP
jgi:hypothetical protein